jgi:hypothetical protein
MIALPRQNGRDMNEKERNHRKNQILAAARRIL